MKRIFFLFFLLLPALASAQRAVPPLWGHRVHDEAHALRAETIERLEATLKAHEDSTTNQIAILIIPSLDGDVLEEYSLRVARDEWKLGQAKNDNGVLLLVVVNDRKMRIEVGQGLEGALPDAVANRIIRNDIAPHFREQDYDAGISSGMESILLAISGEYVADGDDAQALGNNDMTIGERILIGAFIFGILGVFTAIGLFVPGCAGWFLYAFLIPFYAIFPMGVLNVPTGLAILGTYALGFPIAKVIIGRTAWGKRMAKSMNSGGSGGGGWGGGSGWSSGSSGGWSSGGSSFSGGGGSFGGGGSSGSW